MYHVLTANMIPLITISIEIIQMFTQTLLARKENPQICQGNTNLEILETDQQHYKLVFGGIKQVCINEEIIDLLRILIKT